MRPVGWMVLGLASLIVLFFFATRTTAQTSEVKPPTRVQLGSVTVNISADGKISEVDTGSDLSPCVNLHTRTQLQPKLQDGKMPPCDKTIHRSPFVKYRYLQYPLTDLPSPPNLQEMRNPNNRRPLKRLLLLAAGDNACYPADPGPNTPWSGICYEALLVNFAERGNDNQWVEGFTVTRDGIRINPLLFSQQGANLSFRINDTPLAREMVGRIFGSRDIGLYRIEVLPNSGHCRTYQGEDTPPEGETIDVDIPVLHLRETTDNGIWVGAPKVFDTFSLTSMLKTTAQQLSLISPWNAAAITGNYGNLQGVTRDTSYFAAQIQTTPTPTQVLTTNTGSTTVVPSVTNTSTAQCPAGYYVSQISSTGVTCSQLPQQANQCPSGSYYVGNGPGTSVICAQLPNSSPSSQQPAVTLSSNQVNAAPQSTQLQTTTPTYTPTVPAAPTATPLSAPTNVGVSAADMLAEQVQLNAQLQTYQLLLQGAQSDQFVLENSRAVAQRAQTTIGFQISIDPQRQFKHAVAEMRVVIVPHPNGDQYTAPDSGKVSVVNLLPSAKTYNVAKVTSHQDAFGAGAVIETVNVGFNTGRSKDRLYLAKESDTVALQYPDLMVPPLEPPFKEKVWQTMQEVYREERLDQCEDAWSGDQVQIENASVTFGWQFRPVLGADYIAAGARQVFAQLALPTRFNEEGFAPAVYVQTRWREYDEKKQVVGPIFRSSCNWIRIQDAVSIVTPLRVHDVRWEDVGGGTLKVRARGDFFAAGMSVMTGNTNIPPTTFDGSSIQFFAPAQLLLQNGSIELLGEGGQTTPLAIKENPNKDPKELPNEQCGISGATLIAVPQPDGNSQAALQVTYGANYDRKSDGDVHPLLLIGNDVYGVQQKPFVDSGQEDSCTLKDGQSPPLTCTYRFLASTDSLRAAQTFLVRDIAWQYMSKVSAIQIAPAFTQLTQLTPPPPPPKDDGTPKAGAARQAARTQRPPVQGGSGADNKPKADSKPRYAITGSGFRIFAAVGCKKKPDDPYGLAIYVDDRPATPLTCDNATFLNDTTVLVTLDKSPQGKQIKLQWDPQNSTFATAYAADARFPILWDLSVPITPKTGGGGPPTSPAYLYTGDSETVTFSGMDFSHVVDVKFEGTPLTLAEKPTPSNLKVQVSQSVTQKPGHKEFIADTVDPKTQKAGKPISVSIDVFHR